MNENVMSLLDAELEHAGEGTALSPQMLLLEQLRITPEKELKPMEFLFRLFGKPCFPRGELVAITGKAKSGKTFVTSMLMSNSLSPDPSRGGEGSNYQMGRGGTAVVREGSGCRLALRKFKYNQLLHQALEQKIIEKSQRDSLTVYRPAPLLKSRPPLLYLSPPIRG